LLDSGALYLALGAVLCIVIGIGAARRLFQGREKWTNPSDKKTESITVVSLIIDG
jgi:hypothetical protein